MAGPNYSDEWTALEAHFIAGWATAGRTEPVSYPNEEFTPPSPSDGTGWARWNADSIDAERASIGLVDPLFRFFELVIVEVFVPKDIGTKLASAMADVAGSLYMGSLAPAGFRFLNPPRIVTVGDDGEGWWKLNVLVPYQRDEIIN